ncbi:MULTISPECIES: hypothetical protein [unclassified Streptomyces]|uniref:DUF7144 family membrane protein n=1 Tax=unclassified Streptomyces TaxID=2593676 RepID=UPI0021C58A4D|nr:hypothetical protein [Streptomyces sp. FIT100]UUN28106.1 hypothetical protein KK483_18225 [Streptomyces sp. FIT100]
MSQNTAPRGQGHRTGTSTDAWSAGGTLFAGVLMTVVGIMDIIEGIAAIAEDDVYTRIGDYVFSFSLTGWGWIHLILGVILVVTGWGILKDAEWARVAGIALAALNIVAQFLFLPYQPVWAIFSMAISVFVIWALATDRTTARV